MKIELAEAICDFLDWFEDNMNGETWLDTDADPNDPEYNACDNGIWRPYTELPQYVALKNQLTENADAP